MKDRTTNGMFRIIAAPSGQAPLAIREKWIGVEIPYTRLEEPKLLRGILDGTPVKGHNGFITSQETAISALSKKCPEAAEWWNEMGFPQPFGEFHFCAECGEIID